jgi:hypothetical protein
MVLSLLPLGSVSADGSFNAVKKDLSALLLGDYLMGIGTDGACSVIKANGLMAKLKKFNGLTNLVCNRCIVNRLNLTS